MIEVFRTNVGKEIEATLLVVRIELLFPQYKVNFDLSDADRIMRVQSTHGAVDPLMVISLLHDSGFRADVLPDDLPDDSWLKPFKKFRETISG